MQRTPRVPGAAGLCACQPSPSAGHSSRGTPRPLKAEQWCQEQGLVVGLHLLAHPPARTGYPVVTRCWQRHIPAWCCQRWLTQPLSPQDLGSKDLKRERLFLVCQIIRVGRMDLRETYSRKLSTGLRRPFGISGESRLCCGCREETPQCSPWQHPPSTHLLATGLHGALWLRGAAVRGSNAPGLLLPPARQGKEGRARGVGSLQAMPQHGTLPCTGG